MRASSSRNLLSATLFVICSFFVFILWKVVPVYAALWAGRGDQLGLGQRILISTSNFVGRYAILVLPLMIVFCIVLPMLVIRESHEE